MAEEENTGQAEAGASATGKSKRLLFIAIAAVLLLGGGGAAAWMFLSGDSEAPSDEERREPVSYVEISPSFVVNFPHQGRQRFLQTEVTVMGRDSEAMDAVVEHMPAIRHELITLFNAQLLLVFEDPSGIERLRELATREVQQVLQREIGREGIDEVLFTTFVMQ